MMKKMISIIMTLLLVLSVSSCSKDWEIKQQSEYHFYQEEYSEQYRTYEIDFDLDHKKENKILITSDCVSGTIQIGTDCQIDGFPYCVGSNEPLDTEFELAAYDVGHIVFTVEIDEETEGDIIVTLYSK